MDYLFKKFQMDLTPRHYHACSFVTTLPTMTPAKKTFALSWPDALVLVLAAVLAVVFLAMHFGVTRLM